LPEVELAFKTIIKVTRQCKTVVSSKNWLTRFLAKVRTVCIVAEETRHYQLQQQNSSDVLTKYLRVLPPWLVMEVYKSAPIFNSKITVTINAIKYQTNLINYKELHILSVCLMVVNQMSRKLYTIYTNYAFKIN